MSDLEEVEKENSTLIKELKKIEQSLRLRVTEAEGKNLDYDDQ